MVLVWAWDLVASPLMLPNSTEEVEVEVEEWATWVLEVTTIRNFHVQYLYKNTSDISVL